MPHPRKRHIQSEIVKQAKFWPVICLVGARQVGKSTLLRSLSRFGYASLDENSKLRAAQAAPGMFVENPPLIVDEAQKAPALFDEIKHRVDSKKRPGLYVLTGSVRFSKRTMIRESLTGRALTLQMFPLTYREANDESLAKSITASRQKFIKHLEHGGMPAIFAARDKAQRRNYWKSLIESYLYRDLLFAVQKNPNPRVAERILLSACEILALGELPIFSRIYKKTGGTRSVVEKHLVALEDMMILTRVPCLGKSKAMDVFLPFDTGLFLSLIGAESAMDDLAIREASLWISLLNEVKVRFSPEVSYASSLKGEVSHLIYKTNGRVRINKISAAEVPHPYELRHAQALKNKLNADCAILAATKEKVHVGPLGVVPWEFLT